MKKLRAALTIFTLFIASISSFAQGNDVIVTVQVIPPYSPYLSTYVDQPNKVLLTLTNVTNAPQNLKLWVKISGDNGVSVTTAVNFNPSQPIALGAYETKSISFNSYETRDYFDANNVDLVGITKAQLIQNQALPEGNYQVCVRALDYTTPYATRSADGCASFPIFYIDPPVATQPMCGNEITASNPQFVLFSWTPPATAPGNIQYEFTLKEVPNNLNPNDVIKNNVFPVLYNATQTANPTLAYSVAFPQLETGKKYVWRVRAVDPTNSVQFKNAGFSEACWFDYKAGINNFTDLTMTNPATPVVNPVISTPGLSYIPTQSPAPFTYFPVTTEGQGTVLLPPLVFPTTVSGQAMYHYPNENGNYPLKGAILRLLVGYGLKDGSGKDISDYGFGSDVPDGLMAGTELAIAGTDDNGNFSFSFTQTANFGKVADNYRTGSGEFTSSGALYRYAYIVLDNPHAEFYDNQFSERFMPAFGESLATGVITTPVLSKNLQVTVKKWSYLDGVENTSETLANANVYLCRKPLDEWEKLIFPQEDGAPDNQMIKPDALNGLEVVGKGETDANGNVTFWRMVDNNDFNYMYYVYVDFPKDADGFTNYKLMSGPVQRSYKCPAGTIMCETYVQEFHMDANFPRVSGWLEDATDGKRIPGIVMLKSLYVGMNGMNVLSHPYENVTNEEWDLRNKMQKNQCGACVTTSYRCALPGDDGRFEFTDQPILAKTGNNLAAWGPFRSLQAFAGGYDNVNFAEVKSPLLLGEQAFVKIPMSRGALISGRIVDGETGKGISAQFYFDDENGHSGYSSSDEDAQSLNDAMNTMFGTWGMPYVTGGGYFGGYPAKKIEMTQHLIVKAEGYISDTIDVVINKKNQDLGTIKLYTLKRRLFVVVLDAKTNDVLDKATVTLPEVKQPCMITANTGSGELGGSIKIPGECALTEKTTWGLTSVFSFKNAGGSENNSQTYAVHVDGPSGTEYVPGDFTTTIPYSSAPKLLVVKLEPGTCVSGYVYEGSGSTLPVAGATVKMDITRPFYLLGNEMDIKTGEGTATTGADGKFILHHIPLRSYPVLIRAMKASSQFVGDSFSLVTDPKGLINLEMGNFSTSDYELTNLVKPKIVATPNKAANDNCVHHDFHLSVYNGMDITSLMGFPIAVTGLSPNGTTSATISGYFGGMPDNSQFKVKNGQSLSFTNIKIVPGALKNDKGIPTSQPDATPVNTNENSLKISTYGVDGKVEDKKLGIYLDKTTAGKQYGVMKGKVHVSATEFNQTVVGLTDDAYLTIPGATDKLMIPVFNADKTVSTPANVPNGFGIGDIDGNALTFSLPGFAKHAKADLATSKFTSAGELQLATKIETNIADVTPANLNIDAGIVKLKKGVAPVINTSQQISFKLGDYWAVTSNDWKLDENGLKMNNGKLNTGVQFDIHNIGIQYSQLNTNGTHVDVGSMKLAKVQPVNIVSGQQTFGKIDFDGGNKVWQIYVGPNSTGTCGNITNLPGIGATDKVTLHSINLYSNGQQNLFMKKSDLLLRHVLHYHTNDMASILVTANNFTINGTFDLNLPAKHSYAAALDYENGGSSLKDVAFINVAPIAFNQPASLSHSFTTNLKVTEGLFTAHGTAVETGTFPQTNTTLYYSNDTVSVWIDNGQSIPINGTRKFGKVAGGMRISAGNWTPFWFDGEMQGMPGVSDVMVAGKPQRMKFVVEGGVSADGQSISMSDVSTPFGNMSWTYNFPQSQLVGHCDIDMNLGSLGLKGGINSVVDGNGWYFQAMGKVTIPGVGDADLMGVFGSYSSHPEFLSTGLGDIKCLPSDFSTQVKGFLFQAGVHKQVVPDISFEIPALLSVDFGVDVGLTTRVWKSFGGSSTYGISLLAAVNAHASGSCDATCSDISAAASVEAGIAGDYNPTNGSYSVNGCASVGFDLQVSQCLGALGVCGPCLTVDSGHKDIGVNLTYNSTGGADMSINFGACDSQCK